MITEKDNGQTFRRVNYILLMFCLALLSVGLGAVIWHCAKGYGQAEGEVQQRLLNMARIAVVCLGVTLLVTLWIFIRWLRLRFTHPPKAKPTEHVDAWAIAGKRVRVPDDDPEYPEDLGFYDPKSPPDEDLWRE